MKQVILRNLTRPDSPLITARYCSEFLCKLRGLTFRRSLPEAWGLLLVYPRDGRMDSSIHMFFMRMDLAVVWINSANEVVDIKLARRWRPAYLPQKPARYVLELDTRYATVYQVGDQVQIEAIAA